MRNEVIKKAVRLTLGVFIVISVLCFLIMRLPVQELKITAKTAGENFDISGQTRIYHSGQLKSGEQYKAVIKFMAVPDHSNDLFTRFGTGQFVYLGCSELKAEYDFISFGCTLGIRLTLKAVQGDLTLEDGTPFDVTQYSLKPVLTIEK